MSYEKCPFSNEDCKFYGLKPVVKGETNGCRSNEHHLYGRARARLVGATAIEFTQLERNRVQICEQQHGDIEATYGWMEFPPEDVMRMIIDADELRQAPEQHRRSA